MCELQAKIAFLTPRREAKSTNPFAAEDLGRDAFDSLALIVGIAQYSKNSRDMQTLGEFRSPELQAFIKLANITLSSLILTWRTQVRVLQQPARLRSAGSSTQHLGL